MGRAERLTQVASIAGVVTEANTEQAVPGATVEIVRAPAEFDRQREVRERDPNALPIHWVRTRWDGSYVFCDLPSGNYRLRVTAPGYNSAEADGVKVMKRRVEGERAPVAYANLPLPPK